MADLEGKQFKDANGNIFTVKGGKYLDAAGKEYVEPAEPESNVSTLADIRDSAATGVAQGTAGLVGTPAALTDLAGRGISKVGEWTGSQGLQNTGQALSGSNFATNYSPEAFQKSWDPTLQKIGVDVNYQPQTTLGRYARTAGSFVPSTVAAGLFGPEAMSTALVRGGGAAVGSEALGHAVEDYTGEGSPEGAVARMVGALGGGAFAPRAVTPFPATSQARTAMAGKLQEDIQPFGGNVDAAQATGSPRLRLMTGTPENQNQAVTQALFNKASIPYKPGDNFNATLTNANTALKQDIRTAEQQSPILRDQNFWTDAQGTLNRARQNLTGSTQASKLQEVEDAYKDLQQKPPGFGQPGGLQQGQLTGGQYLELRDTLRGSKNPYVKQLGDALEGAAGRAPNSPWAGLSERYANLKGLQAGAEAAGPLSESMSPQTVADAMRKQTPMRETAQAAGTILKPVEPAQKTGLGGLAAAAGGAALGGAHVLPGGLVGGGVEGAVLGTLLGEQAKDALGRTAQSLLRTKPAQAYLGNQKMLPGVHYSPWLGKQNALENARNMALLLGAPSAAALQQSATASEK